MAGAILVSAVTESKQYVFMAKISLNKDGKHKSKVKKPDTIINLAEHNHLMYYSMIMSESSLETLYGNAYVLMKQDISILDTTKDGPP